MCPWDTQCRTLMAAACFTHATNTSTSSGPRHTAAGRASPRLPLHLNLHPLPTPPAAQHVNPIHGDATSGGGSDPMGHPHSAPLHPAAGHISRAAALTGTLAAPALADACSRELVSLRHAMHACPTALLPASTAALLSLQLAGCLEGRPCAAYRSTMHSYVRLAVALTHRELGLLPLAGGSGGGNASGPPAPLPSPPTPPSVLSMFPMMQLHAALPHSGSSVTPLSPGESFACFESCLRLHPQVKIVC